MNRFSLWVIAAGVLAGGAANAAKLTAGIYGVTGTVASNNGNANCAQVGLTPGAANNSVLKFPGNGNTGMAIWVPANGGNAEQQCIGFPAVPAGGLNGFVASANCTVYLTSATLPPASVSFQFTAKVVDTSSAIGTTAVSIPASAAVGAGCAAIINNTSIRSGK